MTQSLETYKEQIGGLRALLGSYKNELMKAPPATLVNITPERIERQVISVCTGNPYLLKCDQISLVGAVIRALEMGLELSGALGHAYLVPFKGKVQLIVGYPGLVELCCRSPEVSGIDAHVVFENDHFELDYGNRERPVTHRPELDAAKRGNPIGSVAFAFMKEGVVIPEFVAIADVNKIKAASMARGGGGKTWGDPANELEMIRKTSIRRLCKRLPKSSGIQAAVNMEEMYDRGQDQRNEEFVEDRITDKQVKFIQSLRSQLTKKLGVTLERCTVHLAAAMDDEAVRWPARESEEAWLSEQLSKAQAGELIDLLEKEKGESATDAEVE